MWPCLPWYSVRRAPLRAYRRYVELGRRFIEAQAREYGTDSYYAVDQFNEMVHPSHARAMIGRTLTRCAACAALPHCGIAAAAGAGVQGDGVSQHGRHDTIRVAAGSRSRGRLGRAGVRCATMHSIDEQCSALDCP